MEFLQMAWRGKIDNIYGHGFLLKRNKILHGWQLLVLQRWPFKSMSQWKIDQFDNLLRIQKKIYQCNINADLQTMRNFDHMGNSFYRFGADADADNRTRSGAKRIFSVHHKDSNPESEDMLGLKFRKH
jgi:hypothetical protein